MARKIQVHQVDAFTRKRFTGNPAGVVLNADQLEDAEMLAIARELNNADTAFILTPESSGHDLRARFFTPRTEAGFVGHATVAAHYVLSRRRSASERIRQKSKAGVVEIEVRGSDDDRRIAIRQTAPPMGRELNDRERMAVLDALALATDDLDLRCPLRIVGSGSTRLMVAVRGPDQLKQLKPDPARLTTLSAQLGAAGYFVFTLAPQSSDYLTESRMFCPALGIPEDPVSGNAHGLLGAYLAHYGFLKRSDSRSAFSGAQGHYVNRPGRVDVELEFRDGALDGVWIVGQAVSIFETEIVL
jgi:PhzF family phenazine biosynthesis protein